MAITRLTLFPPLFGAAVDFHTDMAATSFTLSSILNRGAYGPIIGRTQKQVALVAVVSQSTISGAPDWGTWLFCAGTVGTAYDHRWDLEGCASPTTYTLLGGSIPPGLTLANIAGNQGHISGTPTTAGTYSFTLRATNAAATTDHAFSITIAAPSGASGSSYAFFS